MGKWNDNMMENEGDKKAIREEGGKDIKIRKG
jgi:hypothetical protein